jgi:hypothetical protein
VDTTVTFSGRKAGRHGDGRIQQAARVVAQVEHQALEVRFLLVDLLELGHEVVDRAFLELAQANPGVAGLDHLAANRLGANFFARDGDREGAVFVLAEDRQHDLGLGFAAHLLDGVVKASGP